MFIKTSRRLLLLICAILITVVLIIFSWLFWDLPTMDDLNTNLSIPSMRITDRNGRTLYEVIDETGGRHTPVPLEQIPEYLKLATIATEDRSFYTNPGVDVIGIIRALWINLQGGETLAGGSTITQQVARNLLLTEEEQFERTLRRKLRESWLAWRLTRAFTKNEILNLYLNQIYYGALSYGVEAAAQTYFGRSVSDLTLAECALIAGIPQEPAIYNPLINPEDARNRQHIVLELMWNQGVISHDEYNLALRQPLVYTTTPYPIEAPHFVMMVQAQVDQLLPPEDRLRTQNIVVKTTLNLDWQHLAENAIQSHLHILRDTNPNISSGGTDQGYALPGGHNVNNAALVSIEPRSGEVLAIVGSPDYFNVEIAGAINMATSPRQPGSALKPFVYAAAFDPTRPSPYTAATMILDVKTSFTTHEGLAYTPANFDNLEHGPVSAREALASSLNVPAVIVLNDIGITPVLDLTSELGISTFGNPNDYDLSLALGGGDVTLLELTAAYGSFANHGYQVIPFLIQEISTLDGDIIYQHQPLTPVQVLDERVAWLVSDILSDNDARSIGFGENSALKIDRPAAVKTGTTTNFHDNWTVGYTPDLVVGVWVGNANHEPMKAVTGLSGAGPIWHQYIRAVHTGIPEKIFQRPDGMTEYQVCALSGLLPTDTCPYTKYEWFIDGTEPINQDYVFQRVWIDSFSGFLAGEYTPAERRVPITALDLPPIAHPWARRQGLTLISDLTAYSSSLMADGENEPLQIITPANGSIFRLNSEFDRNAQQIPIEVAGMVGFSNVEVWLDGVVISSLGELPNQLWWPLDIGDHTLWAEGITNNGRQIRSPYVQFTVLSDDNP